MTKKTYEPNKQPNNLSCTCCGKYVKNTPEENVCYHQKPYPQDTGFGQCRSCFGHDATYEELGKLTDEQLWKHVGSANETFFKRRIGVLSNVLNEKNSAEFETFPLWKKFLFVQEAVQDGIIS